MKTQDMELPVGNHNLAATMFTPEEPSGAAVLMMHGYKSNREGYAEYADELTSRLGVTCLTMDLPGHGESGGDFTTLTLRDYMHDAAVVFDELSAQEGVDAARVGIVGASFGGYVAAALAGERQPKSIVLRAPAIYRDSEVDTARESITPEQMQQFRESLRYSLPQNMALRAIRGFRGNVTIVESEHDESIPVSVINAYDAVATNSVRHVIKGAGHSLRGEHRDTFKQLLGDWAKEL